MPFSPKIFLRHWPFLSASASVFPMQKRRLGSSNLEISEVGLGTWALGGPVKYRNFSVGWRPIEERVAVEVIAKALDFGINFIDTADIYGNGQAENFIGSALQSLGSRAKDMLVATKVGFVTDRDLPPGRNQDFSEKYIREACERSLKRLQRETIDLYQLHCVPFGVIKKGEAFAILQRLKDEGKIREYGVSIVKDDEALAALDHPGVRSIQIIFNIFRQKPLTTVFSQAHEKGVGILARVPLASGLLTGKFKKGHRFNDGDHRSQGIPGETFSGVKFDEGLAALGELNPLVRNDRTLTQAALAYVLSSKAVSSAIPGATSISQLEENAKGSDVGRLSEEELLLCRQVYEKYFQARMEKMF